MHRSGTSATSNLLEANGLFLGDDLIDANTHNPVGFFESERAIVLNEAVLRRFGSGYLDPSPLVNRFPTKLYKQAIRYLLELSTEHKVVGWKDPRTTVTWPCWQEVLSDCQVRPICVFRHPDAVVRSLMKIYSDLDREKSLRCWLTYNRRLLGLGADVEWINFDESLGPQLDRVLPRLGLQFDEATLDRFDTSLVHNQSKASPTGDAEVDATYEWLHTVWSAAHGRSEAPR
ncbi:hypothetical protein K2D_33800 [Planctomycetes bacterium K2D]|nr:hypothetical protein K2D_33800 [Planctomycetes bacterium K2D]